MKRTHKKVLGFLGLLVVTAITAFAILLPSPATQATTSVTDTIQVRVIGTHPDVYISGITGGETVIMPPTQDFKVSYSDVDEVHTVVSYTDAQGNTTNILDETLYADYSVGETVYPLNNSGYGEYSITVTGIGYEGLKDEDAIKISYLPVIATAEQVENSGDVKVDLDYDTSETSKVKYVIINVYGPDGTTVIKTVRVDSPSKSVNIDFDDLKLDTGTYKITATAYGENDVMLYPAYKTEVAFKGATVTPRTADTGGLFRNSNISTTDYLVTGLIIFGIIAVAGIIFIVKSDKNHAAAKRQANNKSRRRK